MQIESMTIFYSPSFPLKLTIDFELNGFFSSEFCLEMTVIPWNFEKFNINSPYQFIVNFNLKYDAVVTLWANNCVSNVGLFANYAMRCGTILGK